MNAATDLPSEIADLIFRLSEGTLRSDELNVLAVWLVASAKNRCAYVEFLGLFASLEWERGGSGKHLVLDHWIQESAENSESDSQVLSPHSLATISAKSQPSFSVLRPALRSFFRPVFRYAALVALGLYGSFAIMAWNLRPDKAPSRFRHNSEAVAMVRDTADVRWSNPEAKKLADAPILVGEPLKIESGTVELELNMGTKLVVEGPAEWSIDGRNSVALRAGKLMANVPKQAIGFTVETPTATVVDLGTEFGIETSQHGTTEVHVLKGKVELQPNVKHRDSSSATQPITLVAGEARRIEQSERNGDVIVREVTFASDRFARPASPTQARQIRVEGAYASSTPLSSDIKVENLIRDQGMKGDCHSTICQNTMWIAEYGRIKDEFVLFDLALHRLESMKVWNWNDYRYAWAGVKQADIYVSTSGKGDPLSRPTEWKLVVNHQKFTPGTGQDDYATPTVIPLGDVAARFVGIVIDDALGPDPRAANEGREPDIVGLSEVQFFGSRMDSPQIKQQEK